MAFITHPKIALIIDSESWAFANIARQLVKHIGGLFDFRIIPSAVIDNIAQVLAMTDDCDITHFFWRDFLFSVDAPPARRYIRTLGFRTYGDFRVRELRHRKITTSVYDHLFLGKNEVRQRASLFRTLVDGYTVSSRRLMDIYQHEAALPDPALLAEDGVDFSLFKPVNLGRLRTLSQRPLVIGWAGNSKWASESGEDFKGLHTLLKPAVAQLQDEGLEIRLELADRQQCLVPHEHMHRYYAKLDLYVCPSKMEGTPNPVLEAMACGVPVISTDVGVVPQLFDGDPFGMILPQRNVDSLKRCIRRYYRDRVKLAPRISDYGLQKIRAWGWERKAQNFNTFFSNILDGGHATPQA